MGKSKIDWTDSVWNPATGCSKVSAGCKFCYAERMAKRLKAMGQEKYKNGFEATIHPDVLSEPLRWRKPRRVFVCSMGDLFHNGIPYDFIAAVFGVMASCPQHTFLVLTKRPGRALEWFRWITPNEIQVCLDQADEYLQLGGLSMLSKECGRLKFAERWPLPNVWLGVSVEDRKNLSRVDDLMRITAAVRFVSLEPMLEPVDIEPYLPHYVCDGCGLEMNSTQKIHEQFYNTTDRFPDLCGRGIDIPGLDWVIVGCESGPQARPFKAEWARDIRDQCEEAGVAFFFKQAMIDGKSLVHMPALDGKVWAEFPEVA